MIIIKYSDSQPYKIVMFCKIKTATEKEKSCMIEYRKELLLWNY